MRLWLAFGGPLSSVHPSRIKPSLPARVPVTLPTDLFAAVTLSYGVQERGLRKVRDVHGVWPSQQRLRVHVFQVCSLDPEFLMPQDRSEDARHWDVQRIPMPGDLPDVEIMINELLYR